MTADEVEPMSLLVRALGLTEAILTSHVADVSGRYCAACSGQVRTVTWPCPLVHYAREAQALDD